MSAGSFTLALEQGATYRRTFTWGTAGTPDVDGNPTLGTPHDLTGCTARMQIRQAYGKPVLLEATTENDGIVLGGVDGTIELALSDTMTDAVALRSPGRYDLEVMYPSGDVVRVLEGPVTVDLNITRTP
jgi:hypothetical protein